MSGGGIIHINRIKYRHVAISRASDLTRYVAVHGRQHAVLHDLLVYVQPSQMSCKSPLPQNRFYGGGSALATSSPLQTWRPRGDFFLNEEAVNSATSSGSGTFEAVRRRRGDIFPSEGERSLRGEMDMEKEAVRWDKFLPQVCVRVLLVESDDSTRQIISALLRKCNYKVSATDDGLKAWETLKEKPQSVDLVLTEVDLPSLSGYALLTMIMEHETCKNIPVIVMSSKDSVDTAFKCLLKGAADFLFKPIRKNELQNLWQHVWRRRLSDGSPKNVHEDKAIDRNQKNEAVDEERSASRDFQEKNLSHSRRALDTQNSDTRLNIKSESDTQPDCISSSACNDARLHDDTFRDKSTDLVSDLPCSSQGSGGREDKPFTGLDLIGAMDTRGSAFINGNKAVEDENDQNWKFLELSLESRRPIETEKQEREDLNVLNHSSSSAFSRYSKRVSSTEVVDGSVDWSTGSLGSQLETSPKIESSNERSLVSSVTSHRSSHREEALKKYRLKRKDRCFEKKVQYQSRKTLAEKRPRLKGHFVRLLQPLDAET